MTHETVESKELYNSKFATLSLKKEMDANGCAHNHLLLEKADAVCVTLVDKVSNTLLFVKQHRTGAAFNQHMTTSVILEPVAGHIDAGETPEQAAVREVKEETGLDITSLTFACKGLTTPGICNEMHYHYIAEFDSTSDEFQMLKDKVHGIDGESIELVTMTLEESLLALQKGDICSSNALVGILYLKAFL